MMSFEIFKAILDQIPAGCRIHLGAMGEPTLNPNLIEMAELSSSTGHPTISTTNASRLHLIDAARLKAALVDMTISIDGWNGSYQRHRNLDWNLVFHNTNFFSKIPGKCKLTIASIDSDITTKDNDQSTPYWESIGAIHSRLPLDDYCGQLALPAELGRCRTNDRRSTSKPRKRCNLIQDVMHVTFEGRAFTCCHDLQGKIKLGSFNEPGGLQKAWEKDMGELRAKHEKRDFPFPCSACNMTYESLDTSANTGGVF